MIGFPEETKEDIELTRRLIKRTDPWLIWLGIFTPLPGSDLYEECKREGLLEGEVDWTIMGYLSPQNYFTPLIPPQEFRRLTEELFQYADERNRWSMTRWGALLKMRSFYLRHPTEFLRKVQHGISRRIRETMQRRRGLIPRFQVGT